MNGILFPKKRNAYTCIVHEHSALLEVFTWLWGTLETEKSWRHKRNGPSQRLIYLWFVHFFREIDENKLSDINKIKHLIEYKPSEYMDNTKKKSN